MPVETSLGISNVSVQPEVNGGIVPEPGQNVIAMVESSNDAVISLKPLCPFVLSLRSKLESAVRGFKSVVGSVLSEVTDPKGSLRFRVGRGGRRSRCSRCYNRHASGGECRGNGIPGSTPSTPSILTPQPLIPSLTPQLI